MMKTGKIIATGLIVMTNDGQDIISHMRRNGSVSRNR